MADSQPRKSLLLTVSDESSSSANLRFITHFFAEELCNMEVTLFYVAPQDSMTGIQRQSKRPEFPDEDEEIGFYFTAQNENGDRILNEASKWLREKGCKQTHVATRMAPRVTSTVGEIVKEGLRGMYDAVVLGRRGTSFLEEITDDSVSHRLLWETTGFPFWVCRHTEKELARRVLVCLDGTAPSFRVLDHVAYMLGGRCPGADNPDLAGWPAMTLLCVNESGTMTEREEKIFNISKELLKENKVSEYCWEKQVVQGTDITRTIMQTAQEGNYAVVAVGRGEHRKSLFARIFPGSVSSKLLREMTDRALWISH